MVSVISGHGLSKQQEKLAGINRALGVERRATEYAARHEERLIEELCLPLASALYINVPDAVKSVAWHTKEIARKLSG